MTLQDIVIQLWTWTPYLAGGFVFNLLVSITAMAVGTPLGMGLAVLRAANGQGARRLGNGLTVLARNAPTFVLLFYVAHLLPGHLPLGGVEIPLPAWFKTALALGVAVSGYVSDTYLIALRAWRERRPEAALLFLPAWTTYFIIIVMASTTASVIGVPEIVARCAVVVGATGIEALTVPIYLYAMLWFLATAWVLSRLVALGRNRLQARFAGMPA